MRISAKIDYACKALLELSLHWPNKEPLPISVIADKQGIPVQFLTQILISLKQLGYTESIRGKNGGYLLAKEPQSIGLDRLITDLGSIGYCAADHRSATGKSHIMDLVWEEVDQAVLKTLEEINYEEICRRHRDKKNLVTFDI
ncbi:MAG: Rrf2 family transcriptional regulator [Candidatus Omnitrophota bacterium]